MSTTSTMSQQEREELRIKADQEMVRIGALIPKCYTPENRNLVYKIVGMIIVWALLMVFFVPTLAHAADPFATAKSEIVDTVGTGSTAQFAILVVGLCAGALTGFLTKNWGAAIGSFIVGMIFVNVALKVVGL